MGRTTKKPDSFNRWLIALTIVVILCGFTVALSYRPILVMITARGLYSADASARMRAARDLASMGRRGRMALLEAVRSDDDRASGLAQHFLREALKNDVETGRDIAPLVQAAVRGMNDAGEAGRRCAGIASEGWAPGLLDEETKRKIVRLCLQVEVLARPEYRVGQVYPMIRTTAHGVSGLLGFSYTHHIAVDGTYDQAWQGGWLGGSSVGWYSRKIVRSMQITGRHTVSVRTEVELKEIKTVSRFPRASDAGWKTEFETEPVEFVVKEELPDDYLQAEPTPDMAAQVAESVELTVAPRPHSYQSNAWHVSADRLRLRVDPPLPVDLAFRDHWHVAGRDKSYKGDGTVILKGRSKAWRRQGEDSPPWMTLPVDPFKGTELNYPRHFVSDVAEQVGEHELTARITLEPSFEEALKNPEVEAYWPRPIELPEVQLKLQVKRRERPEDDWPVDVATKVFELHMGDSSTRRAAARELVRAGLNGRMALVQAVRSDNDAVSESAWGHLRNALREDLKQGRGIEPVVRKAVEGIDDQGSVGRRCADIASTGWVAGLLDDDAKRAIVSRCFEINVDARPEYPVGEAGPRLRCRSYRISRALRFSVRWSAAIDDNYGKAASFHGARLVRNISLAKQEPGPHTVRAKMVVTLAGLIINGKYQAVERPRWQENIETDPIELNIREELPDDFLKAEFTPEVDALVARCVRLYTVGRREGASSYRLEEGFVHVYNASIPRLQVDPPLPVDLAFRPRWHVAKTGEDYMPAPAQRGAFFLLPAQCTGVRRLEPPLQLLKEMSRSGEHAMTVAITLEPSLEAALIDPEIEAYWPRPVKLPEFKLRMKEK